MNEVWKRCKWLHLDDISRDLIEKNVLDWKLIILENIPNGSARCKFVHKKDLGRMDYDTQRRYQILVLSASKLKTAFFFINPSQTGATVTTPNEEITYQVVMLSDIQVMIDSIFHVSLPSPKQKKSKIRNYIHNYKLCSLNHATEHSIFYLCLQAQTMCSNQKNFFTMLSRELNVIFLDPL